MGFIVIPVILQCWCGANRNANCNRHCSGADREGGNGGHSWYHQEDETTEDEDGSDTCRSPPVAPPTSFLCPSHFLYHRISTYFSMMPFWSQ